MRLSSHKISRKSAHGLWSIYHRTVAAARRSKGSGKPLKKNGSATSPVIAAKIHPNVPLHWKQTGKTADCIPLHSLHNTLRMSFIRNTMTFLRQTNLPISYMTACPKPTHWSQPGVLLQSFGASVKNGMYIGRVYSFKINNTGVPHLLHLSKQETKSVYSHLMPPSTVLLWSLLANSH